VSCLLSCGLDGEMHDGQTLDDVLDHIDMSDVDYARGNYQVLQQIRR
jgi:hypothetical protein